MKAIEFISEDLEEHSEQMAKMADSVIELIRRDCQPYLSALDNKPTIHTLWRGVKPKSRYFSKETAWLEDRKPKNTPEEQHIMMNDWFNEHFGHPYRNGVFATSDMREANIYGSPRVFFPIGKVEFLWNKDIQDVFVDLTNPNAAPADKKWAAINGRLNSDPEVPHTEITIKHVLDEFGKNYQTTDLISAIASKNEIMFWCKEYYVVSRTLWDFVGKKL